MFKVPNSRFGRKTESMRGLYEKIFSHNHLTFAFLVTGFAHGQISKNSTKVTLLTIFLKHDQTKNLEEIQQVLTRNRFYEAFPPIGTSIVDWHVVMGIGQILTIETPVSQLDEVKETLKRVTTGAFTTETFVTENKFPKVLGQLANKAKKSLDGVPVPSGSLLMTFILKPNTSEVAAVVTAQKLYENFPPDGSTVVNWYEAQGLGDIVALEFPVSTIRTANLSLERFGWKAYSTEFYATYDFYPPARDTFKLKNTAKKSL